MLNVPVNLFPHNYVTNEHIMHTAAHVNNVNDLMGIQHNNAYFKYSHYEAD